MKLIKYISLFLVVTFSIVVLVGVKLSDNLYLEKSITIHTSPENLFEMIYNMENWIYWFPPLKDDKTAKIELYDDSHKPSLCQWSGEKFSGTAKITESEKNKFVKILFKSEEFGEVNSDFRIIQTGDETLLIWGCRIPIENDPLQKIVSHTMHKKIFLGCMKKGLNSLKNHLSHII